MHARASTHGVVLDLQFLPWLQLWPIAYKKNAFLEASSKAFSLLKKPALVPLVKHEL